MFHLSVPIFIYLFIYWAVYLMQLLQQQPLQPRKAKHKLAHYVCKGIWHFLLFVLCEVNLANLLFLTGCHIEWIRVFDFAHI